MAKNPIRVPNLANMSLEDITDELGRLNHARKLLQKGEEFYKEAWKSRLEGKTEIVGATFLVENKPTASSRMNQQKVLDYCLEHGIDTAQFYDDSTSTQVNCSLLSIPTTPLSEQDLLRSVGALLPQVVPNETP